MLSLESLWNLCGISVGLSQTRFESQMWIQLFLSSHSHCCFGSPMCNTELSGQERFKAIHFAGKTIYIRILISEISSLNSRWFGVWTSFSSLLRSFLWQERFNTRLDLNALGHASPLAATTTLLWEAPFLG